MDDETEEGAFPVSTTEHTERPTAATEHTEVLGMQSVEAGKGVGVAQFRRFEAAAERD